MNRWDSFVNHVVASESSTPLEFADVLDGYELHLLQTSDKVVAIIGELILTSLQLRLQLRLQCREWVEGV